MQGTLLNGKSIKVSQSFVKPQNQTNFGNQGGFHGQGQYNMRGGYNNMGGGFYNNNQYNMNKPYFSCKLNEQMKNFISESLLSMLLAIHYNF